MYLLKWITKYPIGGRNNMKIIFINGESFSFDAGDVYTVFHCIDYGEAFVLNFKNGTYFTFYKDNTNNNDWNMLGLLSDKLS